MNLEQIILSRLYEGTWESQGKAENERNFLKLRGRLNRHFAEAYMENEGYSGWWLDGLEIWRTQWEANESSLLCLHLKKQEEKTDLLFYGVADLSIKGNLQPPGSRWAAEVLLLAFEEEGRGIQCALACREGFTLHMRFRQAAAAEKA